MRPKLMSRQKLDVVDAPHPRASIIAPKKRALPVFTGPDADQLLCGSCGIVLIEGLSLDSCHKTFTTPAQLLIRCPCGAHNVLPARKTD